ncbi:NifB/NifX family molybdenum-iron cluster-binding protein [Desulfovibrio sp. Huiquan2017]|uniref:NifB/NifX family molybdenum-iron cluster-binding protein n=1 Tax=Desulfovibrio sp. Huiquan2017 TaxID=2816861 RepID=UPI001A918FA2|nr:NifB/NifX family molybdenum-iron cluster-binding protein [Desulfovibrio sp. Huiquan2017]
MIIALPTREGLIDDHFGHCDHYTLVTVEDNRITFSERMDSPQGCGCKSDIAPVLAERGVKVMLAGNMGQGALNILKNAGIEVVRGCSGPIEKVLEKWLSGELKDNQITCDHHDCDHHDEPVLTELKPL